jgi:ribonuclease P protein component
MFYSAAALKAAPNFQPKGVRMIGSRHRFHGYGSLRGVYQRGQTARGSLISLRYAQRDSAKPYRVAVVVSRKVHKSAVIRNRIRRRVYEQVRLAENIIQPGKDLVFTVYSEKLAVIDHQELKKSVRELLQKVA